MPSSVYRHLDNESWAGDAEPVQVPLTLSPLRFWAEDTIHGTSGDDTLTGTSGDDEIHGGKGADRMEGGAGDDSYWVQDAGDRVVENSSGWSWDTVYAKISYTLPDYVEALVLLGSKALTGRGNGSDNSLTGNDADNLLYGEAGYDDLYGNGGNDTLYGGSEWDDLLGGEGNDVLYAGSGYSDELDGGAGDDSMYAEGGDDYIYDRLGEGTDVIDGGGGYDRLIADWSDATGDIVWINDGSVQLVNGQLLSNIEVVEAKFGAGNDVYELADGFGSTDIDAGAGNDSLLAGSGYTVMDGGAGNDTIRGSAVLNLGQIGRIQGGDGDDLVVAGGVGWDIEGGAGNDTLTGGVDGDWIHGDAGNDLLTGTAGESYDGLNGDEGDDTLIGSAGVDILDGGGGNDSMTGGAGNDTFDLVHGDADTVHGGEGVDWIYIDWAAASADIVWVNDPNQTQLINGATISGIEKINAQLGSGNDTLINSGGLSDSVKGGAGNDHLTGNVAYGESGNDTLDGTTVDDYQSGGDGNDVVSGGGGKDTLAGGAGADSLTGGAGNDAVIADGSDAWTDYSGTADTCDGGTGADLYVARWGKESGSVDLTLGSATLSAYGDTFRNFERFDLVLGKGNDTVVAGAEDTIDGGAGHDLLRCGGSLIGGDGNDRLDGDAGKDTLSGGVGDDTLYGADGNDELRDDGGRMDAGAGDDSLLASGGACSMTGGSGADRFYFTLGNADTVLDFESGVDVFAVDDWLVGNGNKRLDNALTVDGPGGFSNKAELVIVKADIAGGIDAAKAAAAIGSATSAYTPWDNMLFVVDNGTDSAVFRFDSNGSDALVGANELTLLATLQGVAETVVTDYVLY